MEVLKVQERILTEKTESRLLGDDMCVTLTPCQSLSMRFRTPDLEGAQMYADFCKKLAVPAGVCLIRVEIPLPVTKPLSIKLL